MRLDYKGYRIATWVDDDTSHAQMLNGKKGPERLYVDIDPINKDGDGRDPASKRFAAYDLSKHQFSGTVVEQLIALGNLWVDQPDQFSRPASSFHPFRKPPPDAQ